MKKQSIEKVADRVGLILAILAVPFLAWVAISYFDVMANNGPFGHGPQLSWNLFKLLTTYF